MCLVHVGVAISGLRLSRAPGGGGKRINIPLLSDEPGAPLLGFLGVDSCYRISSGSLSWCLDLPRSGEGGLSKTRWMERGEGIPDPGVFGRVLTRERQLA